MKKILVVAGNKVQFDDWVKGQIEACYGRMSATPGNYIFARSPENIMGQRGATLVLTGHYWLSPLYDRLYDLIPVYEMQVIYG